MDTTFASALARPDDQPRTTFAALETLAAESVGFRLFTLLAVDADAGLVRRIHTNRPEAYPTSGTKPILDNDWTRRVMTGGETAVMNTAGEVAEVFSDHELIASLGCASCINVPAVVDGRTIGLVNCLDEAGYYTPERVAASAALKLPGAVAFLLAERIGARS